MVVLVCNSGRIIGLREVFLSCKSSAESMNRWLSLFTLIGMALMSLFSIRCKNSAQTDDADDTIHWRPNYRLQISDFKGEPDNTVKYAAASHVFISYCYFPDSVHRYRTVCYFVRDSWIKKERADSIVLLHEQKHFDLGEIFARKLLVLLNHSDTAADVRDAIMKRVFREEMNMQLAYDEETHHSRDSLQQLEWNIRIATLLMRTQSNDSLSAYPGNQVKSFSHSPN